MSVTSFALAVVFIKKNEKQKDERNLTITFTNYTPDNYIWISFRNIVGLL